MAKNVTAWSNNDVKPTDFWVAVAKNAAQWANNLTKSVVQVTPVAKNSSAWRSTAVQTPYAYVSSSIPYNSPTLGYTYSNPTMNQLNTKGTTAWSAA